VAALVRVPAELSQAPALVVLEPAAAQVAELVVAASYRE
jgi:hypothetical protein